MTQAALAHEVGIACGLVMSVTVKKFAAISGDWYIAFAAHFS